MSQILGWARPIKRQGVNLPASGRPWRSYVHRLSGRQVSTTAAVETDLSCGRETILPAEVVCVKQWSRSSLWRRICHRTAVESTSLRRQTTDLSCGREPILPAEAVCVKQEVNLPVAAMCHRTAASQPHCGGNQQTDRAAGGVNRPLQAVCFVLTNTVCCAQELCSTWTDKPRQQTGGFWRSMAHSTGLCKRKQPARDPA